MRQPQAHLRIGQRVAGLGIGERLAGKQVRPDPTDAAAARCGGGDAGRYVYTRRPRCPACGGKALRAYKTLPASGDGSVSRYVRCRDCGRRFILVAE